MAKDSDLSNVFRSATDGRLMATTYEVSLCETCDGAHFDFKDQKGAIFCSALIPNMRQLAMWLLDSAAHVESRQRSEKAKGLN